MSIVGIDPGSEVSGAVVWDGEKLLDHRIASNEEIINWLPTYLDRCVIEYTKPYVMKTAKGAPFAPEQIAMTNIVIGRMMQRWYESRRHAPTLMSRHEVLKNLQANKRNGGTRDSQVIKALTERFGGKGTKANPGPLYGIKSHEWNALAVAVTHLDLLPVADF